MIGYNINIFDNIMSKSDAYLIYNNNYDLSINLQNRLFNERHTLVFNIQCSAISNYLDFFTVLYNIIDLNIRNTGNEYNYAFNNNLNINELKNDFLDFEYLIEYINKYTSLKNITPIIIFNDFEYLFDGNTDLLWKLRATMQSNKEIKYIAIVKDEKSIKLSSKHPFYKYFKTVESDKRLGYVLAQRLSLIDISIKAFEVEVLSKYLNNDYMKLELFITLLKSQIDNYKLSNFKIAVDDIDLICSTLEKMHTLNMPLYKELTIKLQSIKHGLFIYKHNYFTNNIEYEYDLCEKYNKSSLNNY